MSRSNIENNTEEAKISASSKSATPKMTSEKASTCGRWWAEKTAKGDQLQNLVEGSQAILEWKDNGKDDAWKAMEYTYYRIHPSPYGVEFANRFWKEVFRISSVENVTPQHVKAFIEGAVAVHTERSLEE